MVSGRPAGSRLFHAVVVVGAALGSVGPGCASADGDEEPEQVSVTEERCKLPDGGCVEHCTPLLDGGCLDPCFVHTDTCSPDCLLLDGGCGWPPTK